MEYLTLIKDTVVELQCQLLNDDLTSDSLCREAFLLLTSLHNMECDGEVYNAMVKQLLHLSKNLSNKEELRYSLDLMESWVEILIRTKEVENKLVN